MILSKMFLDILNTAMKCKGSYLDNLKAENPLVKEATLLQRLIVLSLVSFLGEKNGGVAFGEKFKKLYMDTAFKPQFLEYSNMFVNKVSQVKNIYDYDESDYLIFYDVFVDLSEYFMLYHVKLPCILITKDTMFLFDFDLDNSFSRLNQDLKKLICKAVFDHFKHKNIWDMDSIKNIELCQFYFSSNSIFDFDMFYKKDVENFNFTYKMKYNLASKNYGKHCNFCFNAKSCEHRFDILYNQLKFLNTDNLSGDFKIEIDEEEIIFFNTYHKEIFEFLKDLYEEIGDVSSLNLKEKYTLNRNMPYGTRLYTSGYDLVELVNYLLPFARDKVLFDYFGKKNYEELFAGNYYVTNVREG